MATNIDLEALKRLRGGLNPIAPEDAIFNDAPAQARGMDMVPVPVQKLDISQVPSRPDPTATDSQPSDLTRTLMALNSPADPQPAPPSATGSNGVDPKIRKYLVGESTPLQASLPTGQPLAIPQGEAAPVKAAPVERDELREAQARADAAMGRAQFGGEMNQALNLMTHHQMDEGSDLYKREGEDAQRSVKNVLQRREAARQGFADKVNQVEGQNKMDMFDPNSALSKQAAAIDLQAGLITPEQYKSGKFTAAMHPLLKEGADFSTAQKRTATQDRKEADQTVAQGRRDAETHRHNVAEEGLAGQKIDAKGEKAPKGPKEVSASDAAKGEGYEKTLSGIDSLQKEYKAATSIGPSGGIYQEHAHAFAPDLAAADNPLARGNKDLIDRAETELPDRFTRDARGDAMFNYKRDQILKNYKLHKDGLAAAGFDVSKMNPEKYDKPSAGKAHAQDSAAVAWAKSNPNDPRSAQILQANGGQ